MLKHLILGVCALIITASDATAGTLERVQGDGVIRCGVRELGQALSYVDQNGSWAGFYPEICRAIASAVLDDPDSVEFVVTGSDVRFDSLRADEFDVLIESATWTLSRDADGLDFIGLYLFDGQGVLTYKPSGFKSITDLKGRDVCIEGSTTSVGNLRDYSKTHGLDITMREFNTMEGAFAAFFDRQCDAISTDVLAIASVRETLAPNPLDYEFLPERISKEPLSPVVRSGDDAWADVVQWVLYALIAAEELDITQGNVEAMKTSSNAEARRLLGTEGNMGKTLGLDQEWAARAIAQTGNYGELFARTLGKDLKLERSINDLWTRGGLIWAPPVR